MDEPSEQSPTFLRQDQTGLRQLYRKLRLAGGIIFKSYTMRQIIRSADPVNYRKSIKEISNFLGQDAICDLALEQLFETLHHKLSDED